MTIEIPARTAEEAWDDFIKHYADDETIIEAYIDDELVIEYGLPGYDEKTEENFLINGGSIVLDRDYIEKEFFYKDQMGLFKKLSDLYIRENPIIDGIYMQKKDSELHIDGGEVQEFSPAMLAAIASKCICVTVSNQGVVLCTRLYSDCMSFNVRIAHGCKDMQLHIDCDELGEYTEYLVDLIREKRREKDA